MSLTSFLKSSKEARTLLQENFPCPQVQFGPMQAPPLTKNYAVIGQAFDYLLRFYIQKNNPSAPQRTHWVADNVRMCESVEDAINNFPYETGIKIGTPSEMEKSALPFLNIAHKHHEQYLIDGIITDELLTSCFQLAIIDGIVRAGEMKAFSLESMDVNDIQDLRNLLSIVPKTPFLDAVQCRLNPILRFPSGADCDLLLGDILVEIKTTKFSEMKRDYYQQLLGYYLLNLQGTPHYNIQKIGVYFSRHGYIWTVNIHGIASDETFAKVLVQWNELVKEYHMR